MDAAALAEALAVSTSLDPGLEREELAPYLEMHNEAKQEGDEAPLERARRRIHKVIDEELTKLRTAGVTDAELGRAKTSILTSSTFEVEHSSSRANRLNSYNHHVGDPSWLQKDLARTTSATTEGIANVARSWLKEKDRVVVLVTPKKDAPLAGKVVKVTRGGQ